MKNVSDRLSYKSSGVDIDKAQDLVSNIKDITTKQDSGHVLSQIGGFGGLYDLSHHLKSIQHPVLVSTTDGVGTKVKIASHMGIHNTIGIDLVAMCANDLIVQGARPLFFLDYFATSELNVEEVTQIIKGISQGCHLASMDLVGGETAEMPGIYNKNEYDIAGFAVGIADKNKMLPSDIQEGDIILGLPSSGIHSNGFSLVRQILNTCNIDLSSTCTLDHKSSWGEYLLTPTTIYIKPLLDLMSNIQVKAMAHITGGGLTDNIPRILPENLSATIDCTTWDRQDIFSWIQKAGNITDEEMLRTFNCGIGMVVIVDSKVAKQACTLLNQHQISANPIGKITKGDCSVIYDK